MKKMNNKGFSLVELIIVIAIMAILAGAIAPALIRYIDKSRRSNDVSSCDTIETAVNTALGNETISEYLTTPAADASGKAGAGVVIKFDAGAKTSSTDNKDNEPCIVITGTSSTFESSNGKTATEAEEITIEELKASFGEKIPKLKYKKDAKTEEKANYDFYCAITPAGSVEVFIAKDGDMSKLFQENKVVDEEGYFEICPEVCDSYQ